MTAPVNDRHIDDLGSALIRHLDHPRISPFLQAEAEARFQEDGRMCDWMVDPTSGEQVLAITIRVLASYIALLVGFCLAVYPAGRAIKTGLYFLVPGLQRFLEDRAMQQEWGTRRIRSLIGSCEIGDITCWIEFDYLHRTKTTYTTHRDGPRTRRDLVVQPMAALSEEKKP